MAEYESRNNSFTLRTRSYAILSIKEIFNLHNFCAAINASDSHYRTRECGAENVNKNKTVTAAATVCNVHRSTGKEEEFLLD